MDIPWSRVSVNRNHPSWISPTLSSMKLRGQQLGVTFNPPQRSSSLPALATPLLKSPLGQRPQATSAFSLAVSLRAGAVILTKPLESSNIVAKLPGSDPALKTEFVVLSRTSTTSASALP